MRSGKMVLWVIGVAMLMFYLYSGCSQSKVSTTPEFNDMSSIEDGNESYVPLPRSGQVVNENYNGSYWIGDYATENDTVVGIANTQADIYLNGGTYDFALMAGINYKASATDYAGRFMLYEFDDDGTIDPHWGTPQVVFGTGIDFIGDIAWDEVDGYTFYCVNQELKSATTSKVACISYSPISDGLTALGSWGSLGDGGVTTYYPEFDGPRGISAAYYDEDPILFITDSQNGRVIIMYGYVNDTNNGYYITEVSDFGQDEGEKWYPIGISAQYIGEYEIDEIDKYTYHVAITFDKGNGVGRIGVYRANVQTNDIYMWDYDQIWSEYENPLDNACNLDSDIQMVETIQVNGTDYLDLIIAAPSYVDSGVYHWYYEIDWDTGERDGDVEFGVYGYVEDSCSGKTYRGFMDPFKGMCGDFYGSTVNIYTTGRDRNIIMWNVSI